MTAQRRSRRNSKDSNAASQNSYYNSMQLASHPSLEDQDQYFNTRAPPQNVVNNHGHYVSQSSHTRRRRNTHQHTSNNHGREYNHGYGNHNHGIDHNQTNKNANVNRNRYRRHRNTHSHTTNNDQHLTDPSSNRNRSGRNRIGIGIGIGNDQVPTFSNTISDLIYILCGYTSRLLAYLRQSAPRILRNLALAILLAITAFAAMMVVIILRFIHTEATPLCTPPSWEQIVAQNGNHGQEHPPVPLVEYYVHGRGNGHYARSVAIVETLLSKNVDVRMFIGRATMWRAVNEAHHGSGSPKLQEKGQSKDHGEGDSPRGQVTVTSVASLLPSMSIMDSLSLLIERVMSDCEIAKNTNHYPVLVISDGDLPGMWRAKYGSIPSVAIAHGQTFVIGHEPEWVSNDSVLSKAWKKQRSLNARTSRDANWMIGTNFVDIPVDGGNGVVARSPMRPEVIRMGQERQIRKRQLKFMNKKGDVLRGRGKVAIPIAQNFMEQGQRERLNTLLFGKEVMTSLNVVRKAIESKQIGSFAGDNFKLTRRKLVICYFRDKNGDLLTNALLRSGFDVLLFERGYHKGISDGDGEKKFGQNLILHREPNHHPLEGDEEVSLKTYWQNILREHDRKLLEDDEVDENPLTENNEIVEVGLHEDNNIDRDSRKKSVSEGDDHQSLQNALDSLNTLFKSDIDPPRIIRVTDMSLFVPLLSIADGVASSAGSQLLSECIYSHLNVLALHREDDSEQRLNIAFSKHRFDRLSKKNPTGVMNTGTLSSENIGYYAKENVVHGMSQENFAHVFETISRHKKAKDKYDTILTEAEETMLLRTPESVQTYNDFKAYVEAVRQSPISWSYYHDLFFGITDYEGLSENEKYFPSEEEVDEGIEESGYIDPFQGMPEAASVILEIIDDLTKKNAGK